MIDNTANVGKVLSLQLRRDSNRRGKNLSALKIQLALYNVKIMSRRSEIRLLWPSLNSMSLKALLAG